MSVNPVKRKLAAILAADAVGYSRMMAADAQAVFYAGCTAEELRHTITICALFNFYNRLIEGHGIKGYADLFTRNGARLAEEGYGQAAKNALDAAR